MLAYYRAILVVLVITGGMAVGVLPLLILALTSPDDTIVVGVLVDTALEVFEYDDAQIEPPPKFGARFSRNYLRVLKEVFGDNCDIVSILKGDRIVASAPRSLLVAAPARSRSLQRGSPRQTPAPPRPISAGTRCTGTRTER